MENVKIIHTADLHLGAECSYLSNLARSRQVELLMVFEKLTRYCEEQKTDLLLIAGDLFESNCIEETFFDTVFSRIGAMQHTRVVFAAGNHDPLTADSPFVTKNLPDNLFVLNTKQSMVEFPDLKTRVYGKSFSGVYSEAPCEFSADLDDGFINILLLHGDTQNPSSPYNPISRSFIENCGMDYLALGHIHKRTDVTRLGKTYFAYPGCIEGQGFDEDGVKGVYEGELNKGVCTLEFKPFFRRLHKTENIDISSASNSSDAAEIIFEYLKNTGGSFRDDLYKILLTGDLDENVKIDVKEVLSRIQNEVFFAKIVDKTGRKVDYEALAKQNSLRGLFTKIMLEKIEKSPENEKEMCRLALKLGLESFESEVVFNEN